MPLFRSPTDYVPMRTSTSCEGKTQTDPSVRPKTRDSLGSTFEQEFGNIETTIVEPAIAANNKQAYRQAIKLIDEWLQTVNSDLKDKTEVILSSEGPNSINLKTITKLENTAADIYKAGVDRLEEAIRSMVGAAGNTSNSEERDISEEAMTTIISPIKGTSLTATPKFSPVISQDPPTLAATPPRGSNTCAEALGSVKRDIQTLTDGLKRILENDKRNLRTMNEVILRLEKKCLQIANNSEKNTEEVNRSLNKNSGRIEQNAQRLNNLRMRVEALELAPSMPTGLETRIAFLEA